MEGRGQSHISASVCPEAQDVLLSGSNIITPEEVLWFLGGFLMITEKFLGQLFR